ncbi:MFS transporter, partial [Salmonella sp. SAL04281]|uniref:MFS transporter n=1 Tax=Salmonella sp. SAL04281 TaxID=3159859 RepID=UPI00397B1FAA
GVLLASVVGVIFGPTGLVISSFSLFIEPIAADLDWDRGQSALPVTLLGLAVALSSPLKGWLVDRWGARALVLPLTAALALCLASLALALTSLGAQAETIRVAIGTQDTTINCAAGGLLIRELGLLEKYLPRDGRYK